MTPRQSINERLTFDSYWELIIESPSGKFFIETITGKLNWYEDYTPSRVTPGFSILFFHRFCFVFSLVLRKFLRVRLAQNVKAQGIHYQTILNTSDLKLINRDTKKLLEEFFLSVAFLWLRINHDKSQSEKKKIITRSSKTRHTAWSAGKCAWPSRLRFKFSFWLVTDGRWFVSHAIDSCGLSFISIFFIKLLLPWVSSYKTFSTLSPPPCRNELSAACDTITLFNIHGASICPIKIPNYLPK